MLTDVLNRELKAGDFVLYARRNSDKLLNYGIVVSDKTIFDGSINYSFATECYLITNLDDKEKEIYENLYSKYSKLVYERQKKKEENKKSQLKANKVFHLYSNSRGYYLYLGKMRYNPEFTKDFTYTIDNRVYNSSFIGKEEGYAYLELSSLSNDKLKEILSKGEINLADFLYHWNTYYQRYNLKISPSIGYYDIELLKTFKLVYEDLGEFRVLGLSEDNKICAYDLLYRNVQNPLFGDLSNSSASFAPFCWLEFVE